MKSIAVIGTGIAGLSAAWLLNLYHDVTLFERQDRVGGHSNTVDAPGLNGPQPVDTGFIVYNECNYPNLVALFEYLGVLTEPSDMSFAVSLDDAKIEYGSRDNNSVFGQRRNLFSPTFWQMIIEIRRFFAAAPLMLVTPENFRNETLGQYLAKNNYSRGFIDNFILPMGAAIWSTRADEMRNHPVETFVRFFSSHGLLQFSDKIPWRTVSGGSREYVKRLTAGLKNPVQIGKGIVKVIRSEKGATLIDKDGDKRNFDALIIATHADEALALLDDSDPIEQRLLGSFRYIKNKAILHSDLNLMTKRRRVWSSWNYMGSSETGASVTYWMNSLQSIDPKNQLFLSVNPKQQPNSKAIIREFDYSHPFFDLAALNAQEILWKLQGRRNCWFCGSYFGYGFHEDALQSGLAVAEDLGNIKRPWVLTNESNRIFRLPLKEMG